VSQQSIQERSEFRAAVRQFIRTHAPITDTRRVVQTDPGFSAAVWSMMSTQLGLAGLPIPEDFGGAGAGVAELAVVLEEMGRALVPSPYFGSVVLAAAALTHSEDEEAMKEWLPRLACGDLLGTVAAGDEHGQWNPEATAVAVGRSPSGPVLSGHIPFVIDGHVADLILVPARTQNGVSLFAIDGAAAGLRRVTLPTLDTTRRLARIDLTDTPARPVGTEGSAALALARTFDLAAIALAAEQLGGAEQCLEMALAYARERVAFGRPIGGFQAIKHKFADLLVEVEFARSALDHAVSVGTKDTNDTNELSVAASVAQAHCSDTFALVAAECIHIHGGIGFTWEHDAQLFFKRAKSAQLMFGDPTFHRERIAAALLDQSSSL
jgi:alkylation response protein AidB-like acyl-CoA dehydrogenase